MASCCLSIGVVHRALAKDPWDRYQSADSMAQDLRGALAMTDTAPAAPARAVTRLIVLPFRLRPDPWLDPLRGTAEFAAVLKLAETRHRQAIISFLTAEGDLVLGVAHPV